MYGYSVCSGSLSLNIYYMVGVSIIKLNGTAYKSPVCWEQTTTAQFLKLDKWDKNNTVELFNIMCGADFEGTDFGVGGDEIGKAIALETMMNALGFLFSDSLDFKALPIPKVLPMFGNVYEIPKNMGNMSVGQAIMLRQLMDEEPNTNQLIAKAAAIYLQSVIDGKVDAKRIDEVEAELLQMSCTVVFPIGFFLLRKLGNYGLGLRRLWHLLNFRRVKAKTQAYKIKQQKERG